MYFLLSFFFVLVFLFFIFFLNYYLTLLDFENKTFFECGFESVQSHRSLFSLRFFSLTIIFLVFDMEIMFILPLIFFYVNLKYIFLLIYFFLFLGLFIEWNQGGLVWK